MDNLNRQNMSLIICSETDLKCGDGVCYSNLTILGTLATCETNKSIMLSNGYWNLAYPSEIFWKYLDLICLR